MPNNENKMNDQVDSSVIQEVTQPIGDLHICGACKAQFHDIDIFILHKRQACMGNNSNNQGPSGNYVNNHSNTLPQSQHQKHSNNLYMNNNNNDDQTMMDPGVHLEERVEEEDVQDHGAEVSLTTSGVCETPTEEVVFIEVPQDNGGQLSQQGLDGGGGIVSLQNALMSNQSGEVTIINQSGCLEGADSAVQVVQQLLRSPTMTSQGLEEYSTSPSLLQVLQGGVTGVGVSGVEVTTANSHELQVDGSHTDVISKGLKKVTLNKKFRCDQEDCGYTTAYQKDLERHRRIHTGERPFACPMCEKAFNRADKLKVHIRGHAGNKPYSCCHCNYATSDSSSLKKHLRIHSDERPFKCQICQYASRNSSQLIVHLRTHTGDSPFQCQLCSAKFKINSDLKRHVRLHTGEKPYRCEHCDYRCAIKGNLRTHYKINHSTDRVLVCDQCEFSTSSPRALREHVKSHDTYEMTYRCPICKYTCASRTTLKVHLRVHSNDRPYKCRFCCFSSKQSGNVGTHMRRKHMDMLWSSVGKLIKRDSDKGNAKDKKNANRLRPVVKKPFKCSKCDASFVRQDSLRSHVRHHKEVERDLAQKLENTVQAVLQLSTPVNLDPKRARPEDQQSSNGQQVSEAHQHVGSIEDLVVEEVVAAPVVTVSTEVTPRHHNTPTVTTTASVTPSPARRPQATRAPSHSYNQVVSNRLAFAQNNQNQAIEENFQNNVINNRRMAAAAAAAAASTADKPTRSTISTITSASQSALMKHPTAVASTAVITNNGSVPVVSQARLVRVVGQGQQKLTPVIYQTVSKSSRVLPTANRPLVAKTVRPQGTQLVQAVKHKQEHQQQHQQPLTVATATHQQSCLPQQHNTVTTSHPLLQHQLATANSQQVVQHQVSTHDTKPVQVTFQVPPSLAQTVSPHTSTGSTSTMQVMAPQVRSQQVLSAPTMVNIQQQHQQQQQQQQQQQIVHNGGTPVSFQFVQNGSAGSSLLPQQVQVLLPASAFTHASTTGVQVAQPGQYQQQVILQVPAGAEGLLDSSGQFQIPVPVRFLPTQQQQVIQRFQQAPQQQQQQHAQQQLTQPQVITLQAGPGQQQQQPVDVQQLQQQQQVLQQQQMQLQAQIQHQANNVYSHKKQV